MLETRASIVPFEREILVARIDPGASLPIAAGKKPSTLKEYHLEDSRLLATLHKQFLDEIKSELDWLGVEDINNNRTSLLVSATIARPSAN